MKRLLILVLIAGASLVMGGRAALACSCAVGDPRTSLAQSDAAFVGRLVSKEAPKGEGGGVYSSAEPVTYTFSVERSVKGNLGETVDVESAVNGASCGIEAGVGERIGLLLSRSGNQWSSSLCSQMDPDVLIRAAGPLPKPEGTGSIRFIIGGRSGEARVMALDARMRLLIYGFGEGEVTALSVCPGSRRVVEVVNRREGPEELTSVVHVAVRDVPSFAVLSETRVRLLTGTLNESDFGVNRVSCRDAEAADVLLFGTDNGRTNAGRLVRLQPGRETKVYEGQGLDALFAFGDLVYVAARSDVLRLNASTGAFETVATGTGGLAQTWSLSPDGRRIVGFAGDWELEPNEAKLVIVDLTGGRVSKHTLGVRDLGGPTAWIDASTFVAAPMDGTLRIFDASFRGRGTIKGWEGGHGLVVVGSEAFGFGWGWLGSAKLPAGPAQTLARLDSPNIFAMATVPDGPPNPTATPTEPSPAEASPVAAPAPATTERSAPITAAVVLLAAVVAAGWRMTRRPRSGR